MDKVYQHIQNANDRLEDLDCDIKDLLNFMDVVYLGIENNANDGKDYEMSCINAIRSYVSALYNTDIAELRTILKELADLHHTDADNK